MSGRVYNVMELDRTTQGPDPGSSDVTVRRYLIVGNETLDRELVGRAVADRAALGAAEFHILVPATRSAETRRLTTMAGDPLSGYVSGDLIGLDGAMARDQHRAMAQLDFFTAQVEAAGAAVTGEVGGSDPFDAIANVMERSSFDEVVISTPPSTVSRWLRLDLPSRVRRAWTIPVSLLDDSV